MLCGVMCDVICVVLCDVVCDVVCVVLCCPVFTYCCAWPILFFGGCIWSTNLD